MNAGEELVAGARAVYTPDWGPQLYVRVTGPGEDPGWFAVEPEVRRPDGKRMENPFPFQAPASHLEVLEGLW